MFGKLLENLYKISNNTYKFTDTRIYLELLRTIRQYADSKSKSSADRYIRKIEKDYSYGQIEISDINLINKIKDLINSKELLLKDYSKKELYNLYF